jgi:hypothetical protein
VLTLASVSTVPSFAQQKTFNWVPGSDETVRLDPGFYQPTLFNWVAPDSETVRLDPANYYTSHTYRPGPEGGNMRVDIEARYPVTIAMADSAAWTDATERPSAARNLNNIDYS